MDCQEQGQNTTTSDVSIMEQDKNPFPKIDLFPRLTKVVHFLFDQLQNTGLSDHNRGGGPALDRALYEAPNKNPMKIK